MNPKIGLQTLVDSHEQPFIVIDRQFRVLAVNQACERAYATRAADAIGRRCYEVYHSRPRPCFEEGEDCPYREVYEKNNPHTCLHTHHDDSGRSYWVRISAFPLTADDGETYLGESIQELTLQDDPEDCGKTAQLVGESPAFLAMIEQLQTVADSRVSVLLMGETGTGKELAAKFLHQHSNRSDKPFITVDCTNLSETLVESELFGHERGSFTGSTGMRQGLIELADGGTLFLDEIAELPAGMQGKLLRVLDSGQFRRVGGKKTLHASVRIVCATNRHLWDAVKDELFREDLYYRIACMTVHLPNLRERRKDIPLLADTLLQRLSRTTRRRYHLTDEARAMLTARDYPGNIRELRNYLFAASASSIDGWVDKAHLEKAFGNTPASIRRPDSAEQNSESAAASASADAPSTFDEVESSRIATILKQQQGSRKRTAAEMGISTRTLYRKMKLYGLK